MNSHNRIIKHNTIWYNMVRFIVLSGGEKSRMCVIAGSRINRCFKVQVMEVTPLFMMAYIPKKKIWINCQIRGPSGALCHKRTHRTLNAVRSGNTGSTSFCSKHSISASVAHHVDHTDKCMSALWRLPAFKALTLYCSINGLSGANEARG